MNFKKSVCGFARTTHRQMLLEVEEGTYSALPVMTKECGHFQKKELGFETGGITTFISFFAFPMYLHHSLYRKGGTVCPVLQPRY